MKPLIELHKEHNAALNDEIPFLAEVNRAQAEYDILFAEFEKENSDVVSRLAIAKEQFSEAISKTLAIDNQARVLLSESKQVDLPKGYEQIRKKTVTYNEALLLISAIKHAPFLLTIDKKKAQSFALAVCEEVKELEGKKLDESYFEIPKHYTAWMASLKVGYDYAPRISKTKVAKSD